MRIGSLFTGYGGLDMAVQKVFPHATLEWVSEVDNHANTLLQKKFPDIPNLGDVSKVKWTEVPNVDFIVGGSPCQDLSLAGTRLGIKGGTQSGLWESMALAIAAKRPALVLWENVLGATSAKAFCDLGWTEGLLDERRPEEKPAKEDRPLRALGRVLGDLANFGYDAVWTTVRASERGGSTIEREFSYLPTPAAADARSRNSPGALARKTPRLTTTRAYLPIPRYLASTPPQ